MTDMTLAELATHLNYVAVEGVIYQMTTSPTWSHHGHTGGKDMTSELTGEHGLSRINGKTVIGNLITNQCTTINCSFTIEQ